MTADPVNLDFERTDGNDREVPYDVAAVAESFLERIGDTVNVTPEAEEAIRGATLGAPDPQAALTRALDACLTAIGSPAEPSSDASLRLEEERAARLAADDVRATWERQGDVDPEA